MRIALIERLHRCSRHVVVVKIRRLFTEGAALVRRLAERQRRAKETSQHRQASRSCKSFKQVSRTPRTLDPIRGDRDRPRCPPRPLKRYRECALSGCGSAVDHVPWRRRSAVRWARRKHARCLRRRTEMLAKRKDDRDGVRPGNVGH